MLLSEIGRYLCSRLYRTGPAKPGALVRSGKSQLVQGGDIVKLNLI